MLATATFLRLNPSLRGTAKKELCQAEQQSEERWRQWGCVQRFSLTCINSAVKRNRLAHQTRTELQPLYKLPVPPNHFLPNRVTPPNFKIAQPSFKASVERLALQNRTRKESIADIPGGTLMRHCAFKEFPWIRDVQRLTCRKIMYRVCSSYNEQQRTRGCLNAWLCFCRKQKQLRLKEQLQRLESFKIVAQTCLLQWTRLFVARGARRTFLVLRTLRAFAILRSQTRQKLQAGECLPRALITCKASVKN